MALIERNVETIEGTAAPSMGTERSLTDLIDRYQ
jgi:hypothetical protein